MTFSIQQLYSDVSTLVIVTLCGLLGYFATWWCKNRWCATCQEAKQCKVADDEQPVRVEAHSVASVKRRARRQAKSQSTNDATVVSQELAELPVANACSNHVEAEILPLAEETGVSPDSITNTRVDKIMAKKALRKARKMQVAATSTDDNVKAAVVVEEVLAVEVQELSTTVQELVAEAFHAVTESSAHNTEDAVATVTDNVAEEVANTPDEREGNSARPNDMDTADFDDIEVIDGFDHGDLAQEADIDQELDCEDALQDQAAEDAPKEQAGLSASRLVWSSVNDDNDLCDLHTCPELRTRIAEYEKVAQASHDSDRDTREHDSSSCDVDDDWEDDQSPMQDWNNDENDGKTWWKSNWKSSWKDEPADGEDEWMKPFDDIFAARYNANKPVATSLQSADQNFVGDYAVGAQMQPVFSPDGQQQFYTDGDVIYMLACVEIPPGVDTTPVTSTGVPKIEIVLVEELGLDSNTDENCDARGAVGYQTDDEF